MPNNAASLPQDEILETNCDGACTDFVADQLFGEVCIGSSYSYSYSCGDSEVSKGSRGIITAASLGGVPDAGCCLQADGGKRQHFKTLLI